MLRSLCRDLSLLAVSPTWESLFFVSSQVVCYDEQRPSLVVRAPGLFQTFVCVFFLNPEENFISSLLGGVYYHDLTLCVQLKPKPVPLGLWVARMGSVMPLPSGPRPIPGLQPMVCSMRFPMLVSGIGGAVSPTTPEGAVEPRGAALRLRLISPVQSEPRCPLVCLLAVFTEQVLRCPLSESGSQCNCPCSLLEPELNHGSWVS